MDAKSGLLDDDIKPEDAIWFNEDLTKTRSELLFRARKAKKQGQIEGVWTSDGTVLVKNKKGLVVPLKNVAHLDTVNN